MTTNLAWINLRSMIELVPEKNVTCDGQSIRIVGLYALRRKNFSRKQIFGAEDTAKDEGEGKMLSRKIDFGEEEHNRESTVNIMEVLLSVEQIKRKKSSWMVLELLNQN